MDDGLLTDGGPDEDGGERMRSEPPSTGPEALGS
jgi:hypothetical protein